MLPPVGQVIFVDPHFFPAEVEVTQSYLVWIVFEADPPALPIPYGFPRIQSISALAFEKKRDGTFITSRRFAPVLEWSRPPALPLRRRRAICAGRRELHA